MQVEVFVSDEGCFVVIPRGRVDKLPEDKGPWGKLKDLDLARDSEPRAGLDTAQCLQDIERQGYHIADIHLGA